MAAGIGKNVRRSMSARPNSPATPIEAVILLDPVVPVDLPARIHLLKSAS